jgi:predicted DsbA family dithiol-disulfide isomerase
VNRDALSVVEIEIYSDVVCPWCYIGKRRLDRALESFQGDVRVHFRPFQLDPRPVREPQPLLDALAAKFGGPDRARQIAAQTTQVAAKAGLELRFDRAVSANTFDAHRLIWFADQHGLAADMTEALHRAHFTDGVDIGSHAALAGLAAEVGLDPARVRAFLASPAGASEVRTQLATARDLGITSVPTFVFARRYAVTGAQEPETLRAVLDEVASREAERAADSPAD